MHDSVRDFVARVLNRENVEGKRVLEVGARNVNGSIRPYITGLGPAEYIATDRRKGPGVDRRVSAYKLVETFGCNAFDIVLCLETLEHVIHWRSAVWHMLQVLRTNGIWIMTTRSVGFPRHDHPDDHWRWNANDWDELRSHGSVLVLEDDPQYPGMFLVFMPMGPYPMQPPSPPRRRNRKETA